jgi:hypothetical protein
MPDFVNDNVALPAAKNEQTVPLGKEARFIRGQDYNALRDAALSLRTARSADLAARATKDSAQDARMAAAEATMALVYPDHTATLAAQAAVAARVEVDSFAADSRSRARVLDLSRARAPNALAPLSTPVPYSGDELVHPDVYFNESGWNGYRYWMAVTPYEGTDSQYENPSVYASNDGQAWETPAGLTNPIVPYPGALNGYNSDPDLVDGRDGKLYLFYRHRHGSQNDIYVTSSTTGAVWGAPVLTLVSLDADDGAASPGIVFDGETWTMYYVSLPTVGAKTIRKRTAASPVGPWSAPVAVTIAAAPVGKEFWHLDAIQRAGQTILLLCIANAGGFGANGSLYFATSSDGESFSLAPAPALGPVGGWQTTIYRATFVQINDGHEERFAIWYSANGASGWKLGYTEATLRPQSVASLLDTVTPSFLYEHTAGRAITGTLRTKVADVFNRPDSAVSPGTPAVGAAWQVPSGVFGIAGRYLYQPTGVNSRAYIEAGVADCHVLAHFAAFGTEAYLMIRYQDTLNYLRLGKRSTGDYQLQRIVAGSVAATPWSGSVMAADGDWLEVVTSGDQVAVYLNGALQTQITESTYQTQTKFGIQTPSAAARVGAFIVY